jgi:hypothetical protein
MNQRGRQDHVIIATSANLIRRWVFGVHQHRRLAPV